MFKSLTALAVLLSCTAQAQTYGPYPQETYTTCGDPNSPVAVELIHGGGWVGGSNTTIAVTTICSYLGAHGAYVVSINYRLSKDAPWPAQLQDAQAALAWMRQNLPNKRIGVVGASAGGHIALSMGQNIAPMIYAPTDPSGEAPSLNAEGIQPDFVVDISGPTNLADPTVLPWAVNYLFTNNGMLKTVAQSFASPIAHITTDMPPLLISHGTDDTVVAVSQSGDFVNMARKQGIPIRLVNSGSGNVALSFSGITYDTHPGGHVLDGANLPVLLDEITRFAKGPQNARH